VRARRVAAALTVAAGKAAALTVAAAMAAATAA
jgi:hypothetical protein